MLNALTSYQFEESPVRVVLVDGEPWFVANDVAVVLGYRDATAMTRNLDEDEKGTHIVCTPGGDQPMTIINESGLYNAIFKSRREEAGRFRRWVTGEVLPELRRTGRYELPGLPEPPPLVDQDIDVARLTAAIGVVREARQVWGPLKTRDIWIQLGLPAPLADSSVTMEGDAIVGELRAATAGMRSATTDELLTALGVTPAERHSFKTRRRVHEAIRLQGWRQIKERRDGAPVNVWAAPERLATSGQEGR